MNVERRDFLAGLASLAAFGGSACATLKGGGQMYGLIGKVLAAPGKRDALAAILMEGTDAMPGCLSYIVAADTDDADALWVTEVWDSEASHKASLSLPAVRDAISRGTPLIASFEKGATTTPLGGLGLES